MGTTSSNSLTESWRNFELSIDLSSYSEDDLIDATVVAYIAGSDAEYWHDDVGSLFKIMDVYLVLAEAETEDSSGGGGGSTSTTTEEPPADTMCFTEVKTEGEGDDAVTTETDLQATWEDSYTNGVSAQTYD